MTAVYVETPKRPSLTVSWVPQAVHDITGNKCVAISSSAIAIQCVGTNVYRIALISIAWARCTQKWCHKRNSSTSACKQLRSLLPERPFTFTPLSRCLAACTSEQAFCIERRDASRHTRTVASVIKITASRRPRFDALARVNTFAAPAPRPMRPGSWRDSCKYPVALSGRYDIDVVSVGLAVLWFLNACNVVGSRHRPRMMAESVFVGENDHGFISNTVMWQARCPFERAGRLATILGSRSSVSHVYSSPLVSLPTDMLLLMKLRATSE